MTNRTPGIFGIRNWADDGVLSGGSWLTALPLANLQNRQVKKRARSSNAALTSTKFFADLGAPQGVRIAALIAHNLTQDATWRVRLSQTDATLATSDYDSGWLDVYPPIVPFGLLPWGLFNWGQALSTSELGLFGGYAIIVTSDVQVAQYALVEISDTANPDGYVQAGRFLLMDAFEPLRGQEFGWSMQHVDPSTSREARGGQRWFNTLNKYRVCSLALGALSQDEQWGQVDLIDRMKGTTGEILFVPLPDDAENRFRQAIFGTFQSLGDSQNFAPDLYARRFSIRELV